MKVKNSICLCLAVTFFYVFASQTVVLAKQMSFAIVSIQKIIDSSTAGMEARKVIEAKQSVLEPMFREEQEQLKASAKEIETKSSIWSDEVRGTKEREYQKKMREYQMKVEDAQYELQQLEKKVLEPIFKQLQGIIVDLGKKNGLTMIFEKSKKGSGILYADEAIDISDEVIKALNSVTEKK